MAGFRTLILLVTAVAPLFPDMISCMAIQVLEIKKSTWFPRVLNRESYPSSMFVASGLSVLDQLRTLEIRRNRSRDTRLFVGEHILDTSFGATLTALRCTTGLQRPQSSDTSFGCSDNVIDHLIYNHIRSDRPLEECTAGYRSLCSENSCHQVNAFRYLYICSESF